MVARGLKFATVSSNVYFRQFLFLKKSFSNVVNAFTVLKPLFFWEH